MRQRAGKGCGLCDQLGFLRLILYLTHVDSLVIHPEEHPARPAVHRTYKPPAAKADQPDYQKAAQQNCGSLQVDASAS